MKSEEKNGTGGGRVRIAVLGMISVGKSALTVRYLTRRFIGEYRSNTDLLYRQTVTVNSTPLEVEIVDVSGETRDSSIPEEAVQWADACVIVYSITDRESYRYAVKAVERLQKLQLAPMQRATQRASTHSPPNSPSQNGTQQQQGSPTPQLPLTILANKADLEHLRQVQEAEGRNLAASANAHFYEVSVAENSSEIYHAFEALVNECRCINGQNGNGKTRKFSVSKMIGTLIGNAGKNGNSYCDGSNTTSNSTGTVVVCQKADLYRNDVMKRRQNYSATASL